MTTSATTTSTTMVDKLQSILAKHLPDPASIREALNTVTDHALWQELADLFNNNNNEEQLQALLNVVHEQQDEMYPLPTTAYGRPHPKQVDRVRQKVAPMAAHRSNFADWNACRVTGEYHTFDQCKQQVLQSLTPDTIVVWRYNYDDMELDKADIMHVGYAYRPGALAIMEIQILEPIAAWVFTSNSLNKHAHQTGRVTFKESKDLYSAMKTAILQNSAAPTLDTADIKNVMAYYQRKREEKRDATPLDTAALVDLQELVNSRFSFLGRPAKSGIFGMGMTSGLVVLAGVSVALFLSRR